MSDKDNENTNSQNGAEDGSENNQGSGNSGAPADDGAGAGIDDELDDDSIDAMEDADELKEKLKSQSKQNKKLFERTMKAEGKVLDKTSGKWVKKEKPAPTPAAPAAQDQNKPKDDLSSMDTIALIDAKVTNKEDIDEVRDYAKLKGITIAEALAAPMVKVILKERGAERTTANATNTGPSRRGTTAPTAANLLKKANETGELPDSDEDLAKLAESTFMPPK